MRNLILGAGLAMLLVPMGAWIGQRSVAPPVTTLSGERQVLLDFQIRVDAYVALHRQLDKTTPPLVSEDWSSVRDRIDALAGRIQAERANARQGEVFTPDVERWFRLKLAQCLHGVEIEDLLDAMNEEDWQTFVLVPEVNGRWPEGAPLPAMPPHLLAVFPPLPEELQYRFMGRDLILWDMHANVIVDFIKGALPGRHTTALSSARAVTAS